MAKNSTLTTKNAGILILVGLAIQYIIPNVPILGRLGWVGSALILVVGILLLLK